MLIRHLHTAMSNVNYGHVLNMCSHSTKDFFVDTTCELLRCLTTISYNGMDRM